MKKIRMLNISLITGALTLPAITTLVSCNKSIAPTSIDITSEYETITKGKTVQLNATVLPKEASQNVVWSSLKEDVATVDPNGKVTGVAPGKAVIKATPLGYDFFDLCTIEVVSEDADVTLDDYWSINYHFSGRLEAPYQFNLLNCQSQDTATISIKSQTVEGASVNYLDITSGEQQTIEEEQKTLDFKLSYVTTPSDGPIEVETVINVILKRDGKDIFNGDFTIYAEWAKPIPKDALNIGIDKETGKNTLYGFADPESVKGKDYTMLYVPEEVEVIADGAFYNSGTTIPSSIKWLLLDESWGRGESKLKEIGEGAFRYANLNDLTIFIPSSVETIKKQAFLMCTEDSSHTSLRFGSNSNLKTIGEQAFSKDYINDQIILPRGLESIDSKGLMENNPKKLFIPNSLKKLDQAFRYGYKDLELIDMSEWSSLPKKGTEGWSKYLFDSGTGKNYFITTGKKAIIHVSTDDDWMSFFKYCGLDENYWQIEKI